MLAAVALLVHAFDLLARNGRALRLSGERLAAVVQETAFATGTCGLVGGQFRDLELAGSAAAGEASLRTLEAVHSRKTGQLFGLAAVLGPLLLGAAADDVSSLRAFAKDLGLAYQVSDDLLDRSASPQVTGKDVGKDRGRSSFASLLPPADAQRLVVELVESARASLARFGARARLLDAFAAALPGRRS